MNTTTNVAVLLLCVACCACTLLERRAAAQDEAPKVLRAQSIVLQDEKGNDAVTIRVSEKTLVIDAEDGQSFEYDTSTGWLSLRSEEHTSRISPGWIKMSNQGTGPDPAILRQLEISPVELTISGGRSKEAGERDFVILSAQQGMGELIMYSVDERVQPRVWLSAYAGNDAKQGPRISLCFKEQVLTSSWRKGAGPGLRVYESDGSVTAEWGPEQKD